MLSYASAGLVSMVALQVSSSAGEVKSPPPIMSEFPSEREHMSTAAHETSRQYSWTCGDGHSRHIILESKLDYVIDGNNNPTPDLRWKLVSVRSDVRSVDDETERLLDHFVASLAEVSFIEGRCFVDESELLIGGVERVTSEQVRHQQRLP